MRKTDSNIFIDALRTTRPVFWCIAVFSFFINLLLLIVPLYSLQVLDRVLSTGSVETLFWLSAIMVAVFVAACLLQTIRSVTLVRLGEWMDENLSKSLLSASLTHAAITGIRGTQNMRDLNVVKGFLTGGGLMTLFDAPWSVISLIVLYVIHTQLGVITTFGCLALLGLAWLNEIAMHAPLDEANEANVKNLQQVDIAMRNAEVVEAMGMMPALSERWQDANHKVATLQSQASSRSAIVQAVTKFIRLNLQIAITGWGAWLTLHNEMTSGGIIAASILTGRALAPFDAAIATWKTLVEARKSYNRLNDSLASMAVRPPGISLPAPEGYLTVEKLVHVLPGRSKPVLRGLSFELQPGDVLGIIGPSAAGKSSLARLCVGTWRPYAGVVRLDGCDVSQWKRDEFGRYVGYLPQDIELFSGSVRDNIARMQSGAPDEAVVRAAQMAGAHEMIMALPEGYDTDIGPGGAALSAGQRQRLGLARAFYGQPKLLVLDEPDASLDAEGERALMMALQNAKDVHITTLIITHRRSLLQYVNKLMVLRDGEMLRFGAMQDVLESLAPQEQKRNGDDPRLPKSPRKPVKSVTSKDYNDAMA